MAAVAPALSPDLNFVYLSDVEPSIETLTGIVTPSGMSTLLSFLICIVNVTLSPCLRTDEPSALAHARPVTIRSYPVIPSSGLTIPPPCSPFTAFGYPGTTYVVSSSYTVTVLFPAMFCGVCLSVQYGHVVFA